MPSEDDLGITPSQWSKNGPKAMAKFQAKHTATGQSGKNQHHGSKAMTLKDVTTVCQAGAEFGLSHSFWFRAVSETYAIAGVTVYHESGESLSSEIGFNTEFKGARSREQALGSAKTYYHKYMLSGLYGLANDEDDDGEATVSTVSTSTTPPPKQDPEPVSNSNKLSDAEKTKALGIIKGDASIKAEFKQKFFPNAENLFPNMIELREHLDFLTKLNGDAI